MNIKQAKEYIKNSVRLYLKKDEFGQYRVPVVRQRPMFLLGAPGIGKTAIMEQIAQELDIALVSYSMTHHTRQSAIGLPFITRKMYGGAEYDVSEYTMSEIIASVYDTMEESGKREGILFLDEINCISETLSPSVLQFLQYKVFGRHRVPEGWVIVTAGNPPEFNKSVKEFDVVTMDRLKVLDVEADYGVWHDYAVNRGIHPAVVTFLDLKKDAFYHMEMTARGRSYVTARGWEDLSQILFMYEEEGISVDEHLVGQYLRCERIVREFAAYYDLFHKYKRDYGIQDILEGRVGEEALKRAGEAAFDERLSLLGMLLDKVQTDMKEVMECGEYLGGLKNFLKLLREQAQKREETTLSQVLGLMQETEEKKLRTLEARMKAAAASEGEIYTTRKVLSFSEQMRRQLNGSSLTGMEEAFDFMKKAYGGLVEEMKQDTVRVQERLHALFDFVERGFGEGNELLLLVTELTVNTCSARFLGAFGSDDYARHSRDMMLSERQEDIQSRIEELGL